MNGSDEELEAARREHAVFLRLTEERQQADSWRRTLRTCKTPDDIARRAVAYAAALGGAPCFMLFQESERPGFAFKAAAGLSGDVDQRHRAVRVERSPSLSAALARTPVLLHSPAHPVTEVLSLAQAMATGSVLVAGLFDGRNLLGLLATAAEHWVPERFADIASEVSFAAAALRLHAGADEIARREADELVIERRMVEIEKRERAFQVEVYEARAFQQLLVSLPPLRGVKAQALYEPMGLIGGDLHVVKQLSNKVRIFIADATGSGIRAALTTMFIRSTYESFMYLDDPAQVLEHLNDSIAGSYTSNEILFTASCVDLRTDSGEVVLACAGHPPTCAIKNGEIVVLPTSGDPMGARCGVQYSRVGVSLGKGDGLYLVTDGIAEARVGNEVFGEERLYATLRSAHRGGENVSRRVRDEVFDFVGEHGLTDDVALIGVRLE